MISNACFLVWATNSPFSKWKVWAIKRCTPVSKRLSQKVFASRTSRERRHGDAGLDAGLLDLPNGFQPGRIGGAAGLEGLPYILVIGGDGSC